MKKFVYKSVCCDPHGPGDVENELNKWGRQGWELVTMKETPPKQQGGFRGYKLIFKREYEED